MEFDMTALDVHTNGMNDMLDGFEAFDATGDMASKTALVDDEGFGNNDVAVLPDAPADGSEGSSDDVDLSALSVFAPPTSEARQDDVLEDECDTLMKSVVHDVSNTPVASEDEDDDYEALAALLAPPIESAPASPVADLDLCMWSGSSHPASERSHAIGDDVLKTVLETMQDIKLQLAALTSLSTPSCSACASPVKPSPPLLVERTDPATDVVPVQLNLTEQPDAGKASTDPEKATTLPGDSAPHDATPVVPAVVREKMVADTLQPSKEHVYIETTGAIEAEPSPKRPPSSSSDGLRKRSLRWRLRRLQRPTPMSRLQLPKMCAHRRRRRCPLQTSSRVWYSVWMSHCHGCPHVVRPRTWLPRLHG
ncbi:hypothetical protein SPRG_19008 [Saprolegnia parasitica CBS 223.65]|uniref:Uncharacterized protein n=1 Tax=Saprolegnia parasitica (strain CBS 223.65) TaxID=695850 RepID=A0A067CUH9_SAPPC|nr:hypothetical protein SPRG_19008 [Saprolegnia parasitica CBS 223.65]KDO34153.1 hypothetical protein SPRG_19008 [Saprolegnia parasitica CBS 223.65]|eukprot:XP_012195207.1 hypothetical protein SPRG_19008 [Saprolegnia parasitica CBS 223.65]